MWDRWAIAGTASFVCVADRAFKFCSLETPVLEGFNVVVLRALATAIRGSRVFAVGFKAVGFDFGVTLYNAAECYRFQACA